MLEVRTDLPKGLLDLEPNELSKVLNGPTLIHLKGEIDEPLFLSTLLHGNETSGFYALKKLFKKYDPDNLPRSISLFLGNIPAASEGLRKLENQEDYNRIWAGGESSAEKMATAVVDEMKMRKTFASIDVHNNTGKNPFYACVNRLLPEFVTLGSYFSKTLVYFIEPHEALSMAFSKFCPSTTVECGKPGEGIEEVFQFIEKVYLSDEIPKLKASELDMKIYHTLARVIIPTDAKVSFEQEDLECDFCFIKDFEELNFEELPIGTLLGKRNTTDYEIIVLDETGVDISDHIISYDGDHIISKQPLIPSMFTKDLKVIKQDCLGYLMEKIEL
jgi:succinylglutamate desuccinylase